VMGANGTDADRSPERVQLGGRKAMFAKLAVGAVALAPMLSMAAVDVSEITGSLTDIATVGAAVFSVAVGIKLYKWVRRAL
jgi:Inovirus Coat protein B